MSYQHLRTLTIPSISLVVFTLLTWPVWRWLYLEWMGNEYYSHGILILPVSLFLIVQRFKRDPDLAWKAGHGSNWGLLVTGAMIALYLVTLDYKAYYGAAFAMVGMMAGFTWTFAGWPVLRRLLFPIAYLMLMIPLPFVERSTLPLAMFTGVCSGGLVRFLGLDVSIVGNAVTLPNADLVIGAQCSGVNSLIALTSLMALAAYLLSGPLWGRIGLVVLAVPLALAGNILRVSSLLFVARAFGGDAAFAFYHDYSGAAFFVVVMALMLPITRTLRCNHFRTHVI